MKGLNPTDYIPLLKAALKEDIGSGDLTTKFFVPNGVKIHARVVCRKPGIICGLPIAAATFKRCDPTCKIKILVPDGSKVKSRQAVMIVQGNRNLLTAERTALNFLQRLSGVATLTSHYVQAVKGTKVKILDTRKTIPGWRRLDKYAVRCGGGTNHRMGLYDAVLVKDNHYFARSLEKGVQGLRRFNTDTPLIIECDTPQQVQECIRYRPQVILLDNMSNNLLRRQIRWIKKNAPSVEIEISGGVNLKTVRKLARLAAHRISIGSLTHSAPALDIGLDVK